MIRRLPRLAPTTRLAALVAASAALWIVPKPLGPWLVSIAIIGLLGAVVADAVMIPGASHLEARRTLPDTIGLGDEDDAVYQIDSSWPIAARVTMHDAVGPGIGGGAGFGGSEPIVLEAAGHHSFRTPVRGLARGEWTLDGLVVRARGPLGLVVRRIRFEMHDQVTVAPSLTGVRRLRLRALQQRTREAGARQLRRRGEGTAIAGLREYTRGDDPRRIDWKATARHGRLVTRELAAEQGQSVILAVDAGRMMTQLSDGIPRIEWALAAAVQLADVAIAGGDRVGLLVFDDEVRVWQPPARGRAALRILRTALARTTARMVEPDYAAAFRTLAERHRRRSLIVLFTDVVDPRASHALVSHAARSAGRHLPLVIALRNDALVASAEVGVGARNTHEVYSAAAAEELLEARSATLGRMRAAGVQVIDVAPAGLALAAVNRYLELKGRGAI